ncbi:MAG: hypothetical protein B6D41_02890 [Chloroflexi bacterium UTCFX4]|nr:MAG: hypothetical protein B6D41_02890 [Chloroflexi bacterium UTCFX4]
MNKGWQSRKIVCALYPARAGFARSLPRFQALESGDYLERIPDSFVGQDLSALDFQTLKVFENPWGLEPSELTKIGC